MKKFYVGLVCLIFVVSCTKLDTTSIGAGLIPPVDNVNTFATDTFSVSVENGIFNDTSRIVKSDDHILGHTRTNSDFGSTNASIFVQFNPTFGFRWLGTRRDSIVNVNQGSTSGGFDSAFVCLGLFTSATDNGIWGDADEDITFEALAIDPNANFKADSFYRITTNPNITPGISLGEITIKPSQLKNYNRFKLKQAWDSIANQIRIPVTTPAGKTWVKEKWLGQDTTTMSFNGMRDRTNFTAINKGFIVRVKNNTGNALLKVALASNPASRFEVWYKYKEAGKLDTANQFFYFNSNSFDPWVSANANYIQRTTSGSAMQAASVPGVDQVMYIESTPGSYANIKIPFMKNFPKRMIHRAELIIQEDPTNYNSKFYAPTRLYLDCVDTANVSPKRHISVPFDYYIITRQVDFDYYGGDRKLRTDPLTNSTHSVYTFNVTKYVQSLTTKNLPNYDFRLYAPFDTQNYSQTKGYYYNFGPTFDNEVWPLINPTAFGRVKLGGGTGNYKVKLKIIYSNI